MIKSIYLLLLFISILFVFSCNEPMKRNKTNKTIATPKFNPDSAYLFVKQQVDFGPRVPNTENHARCGNYLIAKLKEYKADVIVQEAEVKAYNGVMLKMKNIIGQYHKELPNRIILCAHWDTRPYSDEDSIRKNEPSDGANDGASGVGVLLEISRLMATSSPEIGVDIILFDAEDYGEPTQNGIQREENWCLGSQYWAKNLHKKDYHANFGILLDMVGAKGALFKKEDHSRHFASVYVKYVWETANELGFGNIFVDEKSRPTIDDHYFINSIARIPTLVISHYDNGTPSGYYKYWHTHGDSLDKIDKSILNAVGQTVLEIIYSE